MMLSQNQCRVGWAYRIVPTRNIPSGITVCRLFDGEGRTKPTMHFIGINRWRDGLYVETYQEGRNPWDGNAQPIQELEPCPDGLRLDGHSKGLFEWLKIKEAVTV